MSSWYSSSGPKSEIAVSTRIRLARNLSDMPFPSRMTEAMREELKNRVKTAVSELNFPLSGKLKYIDMADIPENEIMSMVERHIISPEFSHSSKGRAVVISEDESVSIMVGEEDHIRIQVILPGLQLKEAYDIADEIDDILYSKLHFAFDRELGYLTECPTNPGTGLRASVMLHLPLCESTGQLGTISETIGKIGFAVRGLYGEGSKSSAALYQISNQITLGISEKEAIENLTMITSQLMERERNGEKAVSNTVLEDKIFRAVGILKNCRILESREAINLLSLIKLGERMGILCNVPDPIKLLVETQPHMLMRKYGIKDPSERDILRAEHIRKCFGAV